MSINDITQAVIEKSMKVHSALGPGLLERAYDVCLFYELSHAGLHFEHQVGPAVKYAGIEIDCAFRVDYRIENCVLLELKAVEKLHPIHAAPLLSSLKLTGVTVGLLINFNVTHLRQGIRRIVSGYQEEDPPRPPRPSRRGSCYPRVH